MLIFIGTKRVADDLTKYLRQDGWPALAIHGDKQQQERDWVLGEFKSGRSPIMVSLYSPLFSLFFMFFELTLHTFRQSIATDVASRGLGKYLFPFFFFPNFSLRRNSLRSSSIRSQISSSSSCCSTQYRAHFKINCDFASSTFHFPLPRRKDASHRTPSQRRFQATQNRESSRGANVRFLVQNSCSIRAIVLQRFVLI